MLQNRGNAKPWLETLQKNYTSFFLFFLFFFIRASCLSAFCNLYRLYRLLLFVFPVHVCYGSAKLTSRKSTGKGENG